jgi:probable biosynthetic protein (TIGR04098 family)
VDDVGDRLYAAVFFVETWFPAARPMGTFRENDKISVVSTLSRFGGSILDGHHYLFPLEAPVAEKRAPANAAEASEREVPWLRISNSFVKKWEGAGWLKKSRPASTGFERIRDIAEPPSSHEESAAVRERGRFFDVPATYVPLTAEPVVVPYDIVPDRDMNGAGLLYFAMYPAIMDVAERRALGEAGDLCLSPDLVDTRTLVHRKTAYFSNAPANDRVRATLRIHVENPFKTDTKSKELSPIRLLEEIQLHRESDGRLMAISGARKTILGVPLGETSLFPALERLA